MGYSKSLTTAYINATSEDQIVRLKEEQTTNSDLFSFEVDDRNLLQRLEKTDGNCDSVIAVTCQEYCKYQILNLKQFK